MQIRHILLVPLVAVEALTMAQTPMLIKDIAPGPVSSGPSAFLTPGTTQLIFSANNGITGNDAWMSDGTEVGTTLYADIPGSGPGPDHFVTATGSPNGLFYAATSDLQGRELWMATGLLKDIIPGAVSSNPDKLMRLGSGPLIFRVDDGVNGEELWKSDGTPPGTQLLMDINPGPGGSSLSNDDRDYAVNTSTERLYFRASEPVNGDELWVTDGTEAGTILVKDIRPGPDGSGPHGLTMVNGLLFFLADDGAGGNGLWKTDGTESGTVFVSPVDNGDELVNMNGTLFFVAEEIGGAGVELWSSDGTGPGTMMVKDIWPGSASSTPHLLTTSMMDGILYFIADDGTSGPELWKSDGTEAGTTLVKDINPGPIGSSTTAMEATDFVLFFDADDGTHGLELWRSEGTSATTVLTLDIYPGMQGSAPHELCRGAYSLFFAADDGIHGVEPWVVYEIQLLPVGLATTELAQGTQVYPNPADDVLYLNAPTNGSLRITLHDSRGERVKSFDIRGLRCEVSVQDLAPGIYTVRCEPPYQAEPVRFIVQH